MEANKRLRAAKYGYIVLSVLICGFGIFLMAFPDLPRSLLCWTGGILLIAFGCVKILGYLSKDLYQLAFQYDLAFGILLIILGVFMIFRSDVVTHLICILSGLFILADSLLKIQIAVDAKTFGLRYWWLILTMAVLTAVFGAMLLFRTKAAAAVLVALLGISFLFEGILNLTTVLVAVRIQQKKHLRDPDL